MPNEVRGRLDNAIDRAVRGMMQVDPAPGLLHRVADRLQEPARRTLRLPVFASATAVLVAVVAFALLHRPASEQPPGPVVAQVSSPAAAAQSPSPQSSSPAAVPDPILPPPTSRVTSPRPPTAASIFGERTGRVSAASLAAGESSMPVDPPMEPPAAGAVAPIAPIMIPPIMVSPIRIDPLTLGPVRDQR